MKKTKVDHYTDKEALEFHSHKRPGKIEIVPSKNMVIVRTGNDPDTNSLISAPYNNQLWNYINKLECSFTNTNSVNSKYKKKVVRIIEPVGRNTSNSNILFYIYNDGTIEKKIVLDY